MAHLDVTITDGVATLTMNRPETRNALSAEMKELFTTEVPRLNADPSVHALVLTGAGGHFCAGGDIKGMLAARGKLDVNGWRQRMADVQPLITSLVKLDKPLITAVDGFAFGAGFSLALMGDIVLASPRASFCMSFMKIGLVPDFAAMYSLPRAVGVQRAKELMLSAREVKVDEAQRLGIVMETVPDSVGLLARAQEIAASFAGASRLGVGLIKREIGLSLATDLRTALDNEADHQALCFQSGYHQQAVDRFVGKQPAMFNWPAAKTSE